MNTAFSTFRRIFLYLLAASAVGTMGIVHAAEEGAAEPGMTFDQMIDSKVEPISTGAAKVVFWQIPGTGAPLVLVLLAGTAVIVTILFKFINLRGMGVAFRTVRGKYTEDDAPGQITHFQALSAALSATVGLGNIAGVALAIGIGGPGAALWMIILGFLGMTTKFCECTLGVKYREIDADGRVRGGAMYYLSKGFKERGMAKLGAVLAVFFALMCIGGAFGAGNMFQVNQAREQFSNTFQVFGEQKWVFGLIMSLIVGVVIIGGIKSIARVASIIVPFMCVTYIIAAFVVVLVNIDRVGEAFTTIVTYAFAPSALVGGVIGTLIQGIKRAAFSNEAGLGSAPIAHSAVKTRRPASEGMVALLEPFVDTVVVCTMTALVIVTTGMWKVNASVPKGATATLLASADDGAATVQKLPAETYVRTTGEEKKVGEKVTHYQVFLVDNQSVAMTEESGRVEGWVKAEEIKIRGGNSGGVWMTSEAFRSVISWFPEVLTLAVILFCFSTMISWSYYGEQAVIYLFGDSKVAILLYKAIFCSLVVVGAAASLGNIIDLTDSMIFAMVFPNLIGLYFLLPVVKQELAVFMEHVKKVDSGEKDV